MLYLQKLERIFITRENDTTCVHVDEE